MEQFQTIASSEEPEKGRVVDKERVFSAKGFVATCLAVFALLGIFLTLTGYGVALAVESQFGIPHATLFKTNTDLLLLSTWVVSWGIVNVVDAVKTVFLSWAYWENVFYVVILGMGLVILIKWFMQFKRWLHAKKIIEKFIRPGLFRKKLEGIGIVLLGGIFPGIALVFLTLIGLYVALLFSFAIGVAPIIGMKAGEHYIKNYVVEPTRCMSLRTRDERVASYGEGTQRSEEKEKVATCVRLIDDEKILAAGRQVFTTTENIILFDPASGKVWRESLMNRSVHVVPNLSMP